jgi:hypothetical protein
VRQQVLPRGLLAQQRQQLLKKSQTRGRQPPYGGSSFSWFTALPAQQLPDGGCCQGFAAHQLAFEYVHVSNLQRSQPGGKQLVV